MDGKKIIASFLFFLLVVFFCNNLPCEVYTSYASGHLSQQSAIQERSCTSSAAPGFSYSKPTVKRDHVKVRYVGGECGYAPNSIVVATRLPEFVIKTVPVSPSCFISSYSSFLFKLRGPPHSSSHLA